MSSFGDMTKLYNKERHTEPLKTALNFRVPQNPTSAARAAQRGGTEKGESSTIVIISPTNYAAACQWSKTAREHWATQTELLCPPQTPASISKLTIATVYNLPHTI